MDSVDDDMKNMNYEPNTPPSQYSLKETNQSFWPESLRNGIRSVLVLVVLHHSSIFEVFISTFRYHEEQNSLVKRNKGRCHKENK